MAIQIVNDAGWVKVPGKTYHGKAHISGNYYESWSVTLSEQDVTFQQGVLGIFRPKTTKCSGSPAIYGL